MGADSGAVLGILITYHPDPPTLARAFTSVSSQVDRLLVIDNESTEASRLAVENAVAATRTEATDRRPSTDLVPNVRNEGVAFGFNQGLTRALAAGYEFVFLLDQDSVVRPGSVAKLTAEYRSLSRGHHVGAVQAANAEPGGRITLDARRRQYYERRGGFVSDTSFQGLLLLNSGCLIPTSVVRAVGLFDERYFVDFVDYEFSLRLAGRGFQIFHVPGAVVDHNVSPTEPPGPTRLYYAIRELVKLARSYGWSHPGGVAPPTWTTLNRLASLTVRSGHPLIVLRLSLQGLFEGLLGFTGPLQGSGRKLPKSST